MPNYERYSREDVDARQLFRPITDAEETAIIERKRAKGDMLPHYDLPQCVCVVCGKMMRWRGRPRHAEVHVKKQEAEGHYRGSWSHSPTYLRMPNEQEQAEWDAEAAEQRARARASLAAYNAETAAIKAVEDARDAVVQAADMVADAAALNPHHVRTEMDILISRVAAFRKLQREQVVANA